MKGGRAMLWFLLGVVVASLFWLGLFDAASTTVLKELLVGH